MIDPVNDLIAGKKLIIVPHVSLFLLHFPLLLMNMVVICLAVTAFKLRLPCFH